MRIEGQLKDHIVFPPGNTISSEPASRPARQRQWRQAYQGRLQTGMEIIFAVMISTSRLGGCPTPA